MKTWFAIGSNKCFGNRTILMTRTHAGRPREGGTGERLQRGEGSDQAESLVSDPPMTPVQGKTWGRERCPQGLG